MVALLVAVALPLSFAHAVEVSIVKTGLQQWDPSKAYNGYTIFTPQQARSAPVYLIDMEGNVINTWTGQTNASLLENGNMSIGRTERDWDDNIVSSDEGRCKDYAKIWNKKLEAYTVICMVGDSYTNEDFWAAGGDPTIDYVAEGKGGKQYAVEETDMDGNLVWYWRYIDHSIQDRDAAWPNYVEDGKTIADYPNKLDAYWKTDQSHSTGSDEGMVYDWHHLNAVDYNEDLGYVAMNSKHWSEFYVVDHEATFVSTAADFAADPVAALQANIDAAASDAGDFIYRFGNPSAYQQGEAPSFMQQGNQQMWGSHNIEWIKEGRPGFGNFTIFDNGCYDPRGQRSTILEINPYIAGIDGETGEPIISDVYVNPPDAGYQPNGISNQVVWSYSSREPNSLQSTNASGTQRLPNGNTFICSSRSGHLFEITPDGEVVWEYVNPMGTQGALDYLKDSQGNANAVFRAYRYGPDHPAFAGKDLTPLGPITEATVEGAMDKYRNSKMGFDGEN